MSTANKITAGEPVWRTNRRTFLSYVGAARTLTAFAGAGLLSTQTALAATGPLNAAERRHRAFVIRRDAAIFQRDMLPTPSVSNRDEEAYANRIASYSKGLPLSDLGEVDLNAYNAYLRALNSGPDSSGDRRRRQTNSSWRLRSSTLTAGVSSGGLC